MWVNLRGAGGAGKSYPGFKLLEEFGGCDIVSRNYFAKTGKPMRRDKLLGHVLPGGLCLAGRYRVQKSTVREDGKGYTGGLDGWHPIAETERLLDDLIGRYQHGFFESLMVSGTYSRWHDWAAKHPDRKVAFATLDTPYEVCRERIVARSGGRSSDDKSHHAHWVQVRRAANHFHNGGDYSIAVDHRVSYETVLALLRAGGWDPDSCPAPTETVVLDAPLNPDIVKKKYRDKQEEAAA